MWWFAAAAPPIAAAAGMIALDDGGDTALLDFLDDGFAELELELDCFDDFAGLVGFVLPEGAATELGFGVKARSPGWYWTLCPLSL